MAEWLDRVRRGMATTEQELDQALRYYGGPHVYNALRKTLGLVNAVSPVEDIGAAVTGSGQAMQGAMEGEPLDAATGLMDMASGLGGAFMPGPTEDLAQIGMMLGPMAKNANLPALDEAKKMVDQGTYSRDEILMRTGWLQDKAGNWKFEISDAGARVDSKKAVDTRVQTATERAKTLRDAASIRLNMEQRGVGSVEQAAEIWTKEKGRSPSPDAIRAAKHPENSSNWLREQAEKAERLAANPNSEPYSLMEIVEHPELFENEPDMANVPVSIENNPDVNYAGYYNPANNSIGVNQALPMNESDTVFHELGHVMQQKYGWPQGTNPIDPVRSRLRPLEEEYNTAVTSGLANKFNEWYKQESAKAAMMGRNLSAKKAMELYQAMHPEDEGFKKVRSLHKQMGKLKAEGMKAYRASAGENESNAIMNRRQMSLADMLIRGPWNDMPTPIEEQIID